ncbi:MAG: hypothetical protein Q9221_004591 [Calogaya cf. arnoldii]
MEPGTYSLEVNIQERLPLRYNDIRKCLHNAWEHIPEDRHLRLVPNCRTFFTDRLTSLQFYTEDVRFWYYWDVESLHWHHVVTALKGLFSVLRDEERKAGNCFGEFEFLLWEKLEGEEEWEIAKGYVKRAGRRR